MKNLVVLFCLLPLLTAFGPINETTEAYGLRMTDNNSRLQSDQVQAMDLITMDQVLQAYRGDMATTWMILSDYKTRHPDPWTRDDLLELRGRIGYSIYFDAVVWNWMQDKPAMTLGKIMTDFMHERSQILQDCVSDRGFVNPSLTEPACDMPIDLIYSFRRARQNLMLTRLKQSESYPYYYKKFTQEARVSMGYAVQLKPNFQKNQDNIINHFGVHAEYYPKDWRQLSTVPVEKWVTGLEAYKEFPWPEDVFKTWIDWHIYTAGRDGNWVEQYYFEQGVAEGSHPACRGKTHTLVIVDKYGQAFSINSDRVNCSFPD